MKSLTMSSFLEKAIEKHGYKYDYGQVVFKNNKSKIEIKCEKHGVFSQNLHSHLKGYGCPLCGKEKTIEKKTISNDKFIEKALQIHGSKYIYDLVNYVKTNQKIEIICPKHGSFFQQPSNHLQGRGCKKCFEQKITYTLDDFISKAKLKHKNKFDYSEVEYINSKTPVKIICKKHGGFYQKPSCHLRGDGCSKCGGICRLTLCDFVEKAVSIHMEKYDYSLVVYKNHSTKVEIICRSHGVFLQTPNKHLIGEGCPKCKSSKNENIIRKYLNLHNFNFKEQVSFPACKNKRRLLFDFVITHGSELLAIEYNGEHHYGLVNFSSNKTRTYVEFEQTKINDAIKLEWCKNNDVPLLVIPYWESANIESLLDDFLKK